MISSVIPVVVEQMESLPTDLQRLVLDFVRTLQTSTRQGVPGRQLLRFAGTIPVDEVTRINRAIQVGGEQVEVNEW
jgi:hypothetical protein